jgi:hypothetical protein
VTVDLRGCFAQGQAYVALSRARSAKGLEVLFVGGWEVGRLGGWRSVLAPHSTARLFLRP